MAQVGLSGHLITGFPNKVVLGDTSPLSPALGSLNGVLYLAWRGKGNYNLNVMASFDNGHTFGNKYTSPETSDAAPALGTYGRVLFIGWKSHGNDHLNIARAASAFETGTARPLYQILTVVYAPPGTNGGHHAFVGRLQHWQHHGYDHLDEQFVQGRDRRHNRYRLQSRHRQAWCVRRVHCLPDDHGHSSLEVKKSVNYDIKCTGPATDGINHDLDLFYLWLNPRVDISITLRTTSHGYWGRWSHHDHPVCVCGLAEEPQYHAGGREAPAGSGGTQGVRLRDHPFHQPVRPRRDGDRSEPFSARLAKLPLRASHKPTDPVPSQTLAQQNTVTSTSIHTVQNQYGVSVSVSASIKVPFTASLKVAGNFEWTNTSSSGTGGEFAIRHSYHWRAGVRLHRPDRCPRLLGHHIQFVSVSRFPKKRRSPWGPSSITWGSRCRTRSLPSTRAGTGRHLHRRQGKLSLPERRGERARDSLGPGTGVCR